MDVDHLSDAGCFTLVDSARPPPRRYEELGGDLRELQQRSVLEFAPNNPTRYGPDDEVLLQVVVKNLPSVLIKVRVVVSVGPKRL